MNETDKPDYIEALEAIYGPPSQEGFGSAVFVEQLGPEAQLVEASLHYYQTFVGTKWQEWGEETWLAPWKEVYARPIGAPGSIVEELRAIEDPSTARFVPLILDVVADPLAGQRALAAAYDAHEVVELRVYNIGDGEAMSGIILAGRGARGQTTLLILLLD